MPSRIAIQLKDNITTIQNNQRVSGEICLDLETESPPFTPLNLKFAGYEHCSFVFRTNESGGYQA